MIDGYCPCCGAPHYKNTGKQEHSSDCIWYREKIMIDIRTIWVKFQKEGIHRYPDAPEGVEFLKHPHRHMFHFRVDIDVFHNDRDIEFILFKRELEGLYSDAILEVDYKSCEMLAEDLIEYISNKYPGRSITVEVSEDGENGARLIFIPEDSEEG
jgi:hypothetical protein